MESMEAGVALVAVVAYVAARGNPLPLLLSWLGDAFALATRAVRARASRSLPTT